MPYCNLWPVRFCGIFPHYHINGTPFVRSYWTQNVFRFDLQLLSETFLIQEEFSEIWSKMYIGLYVKYPSLFSDFSETWIFLTDFLKVLVDQISWNSVQRSQVVPCGQTDRHDEADSCILQFLQTCLIRVRLLQSCLTPLKPLEFHELWLENPKIQGYSKWLSGF